MSVVVNDFVSDRQSEVMKRLSNQNPTILTVVNDLNRGKTVVKWFLTVVKHT